MTTWNAKQTTSQHLAIYHKEANTKVDRMLSALPDFRVVT